LYDRSQNQPLLRPVLPEIARWQELDGAERHAVMAQLPARMAEAGLAPPATAAAAKPA
jgi:predicted Fe-S protein YdhL (DUF1289 family)